MRLLEKDTILKEGAKTAAGRRTIRLTDRMQAALKQHQWLSR